jgi:hypothetical protein
MLGLTQSLSIEHSTKMGAGPTRKFKFPFNTITCRGSSSSSSSDENYYTPILSGEEEDSDNSIGSTLISNSWIIGFIPESRITNIIELQSILEEHFTTADIEIMSDEKVIISLPYAIRFDRIYRVLDDWNDSIYFEMSD